MLYTAVPNPVRTDVELQKFLGLQDGYELTLRLGKQFDFGAKTIRLVWWSMDKLSDSWLTRVVWYLPTSGLWTYILQHDDTYANWYSLTYFNNSVDAVCIPEYRTGLGGMSSIVALGTFISHCCLQRCANPHVLKYVWPLDHSLVGCARSARESDC